MIATYQRKVAVFLAFPLTENPCVGGSTPPLGTILSHQISVFSAQRRLENGLLHRGVSTFLRVTEHFRLSWRHGRDRDSPRCSAPHSGAAEALAPIQPRKENPTCPRHRPSAATPKSRMTR